MGTPSSHLKTQKGETAQVRADTSYLLTPSPEAGHQVSRHSEATNVLKNVKYTLGSGFRPRSRTQMCFNNTLVRWLGSARL